MDLTRLDCPTHEALYRVTDAPSGLTGYIALHSTALGPAAGGLRFRPYADEDEAVRDALNLSRGMTYKNAAADLPLGGGKAVILGDPARDKTPGRLHAFGAAIEALRGRYWTAEDMGMTAEDMETLAQATRFVAGRATGAFGSGDPAPATARGVLRGMQIAARHALGSDRLGGRTVALQGLGHVGWALADMLSQLGARLVVADIDPARVMRAQGKWRADVAEPAEIHRVGADIFAPCAIGGILNAGTIPQIRARLVAGSANNQLADAEDSAALQRAGILYTPDYVINCGGVINVAAEILRIADREAWLAQKLDAMAAFLDRVLTEAAATTRPPADIADAFVEHRLLQRAA